MEWNPYYENMLKKLKIFIVSAFVVFFVSLNYAWAFAVSDLVDYKSFAVKTMTITDTLRPEKKHTLEITGTKDLEYVLGKEKATFNAKYVYMGTETLEENSTAKWYYYYQPSWNGRGRGKLHYTRNPVMHAGRAGDMLVVAKKTNTEILLLIVKQGTSEYEQVKNALGLHLAVHKEKTQYSWWSRIFGHKKTKLTENNKIKETAINISEIPQKGWIRIYFTPGPDCENNIIAQIEQAKKNIDVAVYSITNERIVASLIDADRRGIKVRIITDRVQAAGKHSLIGRLRDAGLPVLTNKGHRIMHNKFAIFDTRNVETGSYNWTESATKANAENCIFFPQPDKEFTDQFKTLWGLYRV